MTLDQLFKKVVFLIGAGGSRDAGCKLSSEMLTSLLQAIRSIPDSDTAFLKYRDDFVQIYHFILASLSYQATMRDTTSTKDSYVNIEDFVMVLRQLIDKEFIIPYPLIGNWNDKILKWEMKNGDIFTRFRVFITQQLVSDWTRFDLAQATQLLSPIRDVLNKPDNLKLNIFSLNYDLIFEQAFNTTTYKLLDNGFSEKDVSGAKIMYWAHDFDNALSTAKINLFKLHGSLDWEYNNIEEEIFIKQDVADGREPLIIFGSYSKMLSFDPFLYILSTFRNLLEEATIFVVIGYSFHDKYINNMIIQQLSRDTQDGIPKKMLVVDPAFEQTKTSESQFADYLKTIQDNKSINDIINFKQISPDRVKLIPKTASEFYSHYFANDAKLLMDEVDAAELGEKVFE